MKIIKFLGFLSGSILSILIFVVTIAFIYKYTILSFNSTKSYYNRENIPEKEVTITIKDDYTVEDVAKELKRKGLIENEMVFQIDSILSGAKDMKFVAGEYTLKTNMDTDEMRKTLNLPSNVESDEVKVTIREGLSLKEIGEVLETKGIILQEEFIAACANEKFDYSFLKEIEGRENYLEGYLFPDTYFFTKGMPSRQIIDKMLNRFEEIFNDEYIARAKELNLTIDDTVKIASIIERETNQEAERPFVSSVIHNRINAGMKLEMISTVVYITEKRKDRLDDSELYIDSPYNTYVYDGLPAGPISNPGEACIKAALNPGATEFLYFCIKNEETGEHFFTKDYDEYQNALQEYNQRF